MENPPVFSRRTDVLSLGEARYYQDLLYRTIKIGTELEVALPKGVVRQEFQPMLETLLAPSKDMNNLGQLGIYDVVKEHCGVEIQIIGRHPHWESLLSQYQQILTPLLTYGVRMRPTCGLHFHLIGIGIAESIPEIILANLWNMMRTFAPGLKYLTCGGDSWQGLCRRRQHNAHLEFLRNSPMHLSMADIKENLRKSLEVPEHQNFFNLEHLAFDEKGHISVFHVEFRFPDGDCSYVSIAAKTFLFLALLLKAVEISKFGLLHVGRTNEWNQKKKLMDLISNNDGKLATSDTSGALEFIEQYQLNARQLLKFLKSIFLLMDNPAEMVLQALAEQPIGPRRIAGDSWERINLNLLDMGGDNISFDQIDLRIIKIIELGLIEEATDLEEWLKLVAVYTDTSKETIRKRIATYKRREPAWDSGLGRMVFLR